MAPTMVRFIKQIQKIFSVGCSCVLLPYPTRGKPGVGIALASICGTLASEITHARYEHLSHHVPSCKVRTLSPFPPPTSPDPFRCRHIDHSRELNLAQITSSCTHDVANRRSKGRRDPACSLFHFPPQRHYRMLQAPRNID